MVICNQHKIGRFEYAKHLRSARSWSNIISNMIKLPCAAASRVEEKSMALSEFMLEAKLEDS